MHEEVIKKTKILSTENVRISFKSAVVNENLSKAKKNHSKAKKIHGLVLSILKMNGILIFRLYDYLATSS